MNQQTIPDKSTSEDKHKWQLFVTEIPTIFKEACGNMAKSPLGVTAVAALTVLSGLALLFVCYFLSHQYGTD